MGWRAGKAVRADVIHIFTESLMQLSNFFTHMCQPVYDGKGLSMAQDEKSQDAIASSLGWESHEHCQECKSTFGGRSSRLLFRTLSFSY